MSRFFKIANLKRVALILRSRLFLFYGILLGIIISCTESETVEPAEGQVFIKLFGGDGSEEGRDIVELEDGGYVLVGSTTSFDSQGKDMYVVRTDRLGNMEWERAFGGPGDDQANRVIVGEDEHIYVCGERAQDSISGPVLRDIYVVKLSLPDGSLISEHQYGDLDKDEFGTYIYDIPDGGFLITGTHLDVLSEYFVLEVDEQLNEVDKRTRYIKGSQGVNNFSAGGRNRVDMQDPLQPQFIFFGSARDETSGNVKFQSFRHRLNSEIAINEEFYGADGRDNFCTDFQVTLDGGYILSGYSAVGNSFREVLVKIDARRQMNWMTEYDNQFNKNIVGTSVFQTMDGGYILASTLELDDPINDEVSLLRLNAQGEEIWRRTYGSDDDDAGSKAIQTIDGSMVIIGTMGFEINPDSRSKMSLIKVNENGELIPL